MSSWRHLTGDLNFAELESWAAVKGAREYGTGSVWDDVNLSYDISVGENIFWNTGGDVGSSPAPSSAPTMRAWAGRSNAPISARGSAVRATSYARHSNALGRHRPLAWTSEGLLAGWLSALGRRPQGRNCCALGAGSQCTSDSCT